ncbi:MAG: hypothetical protein HY928_00710 [Elusimicrobia bacterium]|nr:hypothetical protein [Elusimicrobiota bacterium]
MGLSRSLRISLAFILGALAVARATEPDVRFDQGTDASGIIERAKETGRPRRFEPRPPTPLLEPIPFLPGWKFSSGGETNRGNDVGPLPPQAEDKRRLPLPKQTGCDIYPPENDDPDRQAPAVDLCTASVDDSHPGSMRSAFDPLTGPYEPLVTEDGDYKKALALKEKLGTGGEGFRGSIRSLLSDKRVYPPARELLLTRWDKDIAAPRANLIAIARPLDVDDERLFGFAKRLDAWFSLIKKRFDLLVSERNELNRLCGGRQLPNDELAQCNAYNDKLNACAGRHNKSNQAREAMRVIGQKSLGCLQGKGKSFRDKVNEWVKGILVWIGLANTALDGNDNTCDRTRITVANPDNPDHRHLRCIYRCQDYGPERDCGISANFGGDQPPTHGEIDELCPVIHKHPPVKCPPPWELPQD